ncbi:MAG: carbon-nitrogen hydrolase family protein [Armatimonadota bacterium]
MSSVTVGMIKVVPEKWEPDTNMALLERLIPAVAAAGARLVITPECFIDGYVIHEEHWTPERFAPMCEPGPDGPRATRLRELAAESGVYLVAGLSEQRPEGFFNTAHVIAPDGSLLGQYDKIQPHERYCYGKHLPVFETEFGTMAVVICADRRWPEIMRCLRLKGARLIAMPTYGMKGPRNMRWIQTRAYENCCWVCFAHPEEGLICDPRGEVAANLVGNEEFLVHTCDLTVTGDEEMLAQRHPDVYGFAWERGEPA